jgi:hypothetical protein
MCLGSVAIYDQSLASLMRPPARFVVSTIPKPGDELIGIRFCLRDRLLSIPPPSEHGLFQNCAAIVSSAGPQAEA